MKYDEALKAWGARQLAHKVNKGETIDLSTVSVSIEAEQSGYGCSCSAEVSAHVSITANLEPRGWVYYDITYFEFEQFLKELVEAADGAVTLN